MISDVLSDALCEIERYENDFPESYEGYEKDIAVVKAVMWATMAVLDAAPDSENSVVLTDEEKRVLMGRCRENLDKWLSLAEKLV